MPVIRIGRPLELKRHERRTMRASYAGEIGRGVFAAICADFSLMVATSVYGVRDKHWLWLLSSASFIGLILSIFGAAVAHKHRRKSVILAVEAVARLLAIAAALTASGPAFVAVMAAGIALNAIGTPLINSLYCANFRELERGPAVGRLQTATVAAAAATGVALGFVLGLGAGYFRILMISLSSLSLFQAFQFWRRLPEPRSVNREGAPARLADYWTIMVSDRPFMYLQLYWMLFGFANLWLIPMRVLYLTDIGLSPGKITFATTAVIYTSMVLTTPHWGRLLSRMNFAVYRLWIMALFAIGIALFFFTESYILICLGMFIWSAGFAGGNLSWRLVGTVFTRPQLVTAYMSIHAFLCGVRGIIGPYLSLSLNESRGPRSVAIVSIALLFLTGAMLIPFIRIIDKRKKFLNAK